jgi:hypothetical protein
MRSVAEDAALQSQLRYAGLLRAGQFSWDASAARHFELFCSVAC